VVFDLDALQLESPETYFQAAFRVQSPWSVGTPTATIPMRSASSSQPVLRSTSRRTRTPPVRRLGMSSCWARLGRDVRELARLAGLASTDADESIDVAEIVDIASKPARLTRGEWSHGGLISPSVSKLDELSEHVLSARARRKPTHTSSSDQEDETTINDTEMLTDTGSVRLGRRQPQRLSMSRTA